MKKNLSFWEASSIITGAGVGGGIMAVPYLASQTGAMAFVPVVVAALILNILLNLMMVEILLRDGRDLQVVELINSYVFRGRAGAYLSWALFLLLGLAFISSLTAYASGAGDILAQLVGISPMIARLCVYGISAAIVFFGLKSVGFSEKIAIFVIAGFAAIIVIGAIGKGTGISIFMTHAGTGWREVLALYGLVMFSLNSVFAVPQAVKGLARDPRKSVLSVITGTIINGVLIVLLSFVAMKVSRPVTEVAIIGIGEATGSLVQLSGSLFVLFAMVTTFWSVSLALSDIVRERSGMSQRLAWVAATAPSLILLIFNLMGFVDYMQIAGGIVALVVVFVTVPLYLRAKKEGPVGDPGWALGTFCRPIVFAIFLIGMVAMAVGSFLGAM